MNKRRDFLNYLWQGGEYAYVWTKQDKRSHWLRTGDDLPAFAASSGRDVYFSVNPLTRQRGEYERAEVGDVSAVNTLISDFDLKDFDNDHFRLFEHVDSLDIKPSAKVWTGGGLHCYWFLDKPFTISDDFDLDYIKSIQRRFVDLYTKADTCAKAVNQTLRLPGHRNQKYANKPKVRILSCDFGVTYNLFELNMAIPEEPRPKVKRRYVSFGNRDVRRAKEALDRLVCYDDYFSWCRVGMSLQELGSDGLALWQSWSAQSSKYKPGECEKKWQSFDSNGVTLGTLFWMAGGGR